MTTKRMKPGPKPLAARDKRSNRVQLMFNAAEIAQVRKHAGTAYLGEWCRVRLLEALEVKAKS